MNPRKNLPSASKDVSIGSFQAPLRTISTNQSAKTAARAQRNLPQHRIVTVAVEQQHGEIAARKGTGPLVSLAMRRIFAALVTTRWINSN
jgi:hypothetical protein